MRFSASALALVLAVCPGPDDPYMGAARDLTGDLTMATDMSAAPDLHLPQVLTPRASLGGPLLVWWQGLQTQFKDANGPA